MVSEPESTASVTPSGPERGLGSRTMVEGERKHVTILFADIKDSMELVAGRDPEEARRMLDAVLERMLDAVHRYDGIVNQVMGDGIMAIFGAPLAYEDHAVRACYAALAIRDAIGRDSDQLLAAHGATILLRIGLNSGEVVVRAIGSDLRMDYSAVGQTTHLAARMEQLAAPGTICLMQETARLAEGFIQTRPLGTIAIKGLREPVEVLELVSAWPARTTWQVRVSRGLTPFVGRQGEMTNLHRAAAWAHAGHGRMVAIVGEPGVGKSRLVWEFARSRREDGWLVLEAAAMPHGRRTAFRPVSELLREYFDIDAHGDARAIRAAVAQRLDALDPALAPALPAFLDLLRVPVDDAEWRAAEPARRRERMLDAVRRLVLQASRHRPFLLVFEDLHWVDGQTQDVLDRLTEILPAARVLVLITYRPEYRHRWGEKDCYTEVLVDPLPRDSSQAMLESLLGDDASLTPLKGRLLDKTEGNPFFLEECVRGLVASGSLVGKPAAYRLVTELERIDIPGTVQAVLAARIDLLPPDGKWLLQTAAVVGRQLSLRLLAAVAELPENTARDGIARLRATAFLVETAAFPEPWYAFPHALTQEVAYRSVLVSRRRVVHARMVQALEELHGDRRMQHAELLGHHAVRGECWSKAVAYLREAGVRAAGRSEYAEAVAFFKESLRAAEHLPSDPERWAREIDIRFEIRNALWARGRLVEGLDYLRDAEPIAARLGDQRRLTRLMAHKRSNYLILGDNERALEYGHEALALALKLDDFALQIDANQYLGVLYTSLGDFRAALQYLDANVARLVGERRQGAFGDFFAVHGRTWRVWCLSELGRFDDAAACVAEAVQIAAQAGHPHNVVAASWAAGYLDCMRGRPGPAAEALERAYALCEAAGIAVWLRPSAALLGHAWARGGRLNEAVRVLEQAVQPAENNVAAAAWKVYLAEAYLASGRADAAEAMATEGLALAHQRRETGFAGHALSVLAAVEARQSRPDDAGAHYRQSLELAVERGMLPLAVLCHVGLAQVASLVGRAPEAARHEALADDMARQMGLDLPARAGQPSPS